MKKFVVFIALIFAAVCISVPQSSAAVESDAAPVREDEFMLKPLDVDPTYAMTVPLAPELLEEMRGTPEEILAGDTDGLLAFFLDSTFLWESMYHPFASYPAEYYNRGPEDLSRHSAYRELVTRDDFYDALDRYAAAVIADTAVAPKDFINWILMDEMQSIVEAAIASQNCPNLKRLYAVAKPIPFLSDYLGLRDLNGISYAPAGTVYTASGNSVQVYSPSRNLTSTEVSNWNRKYENSGATLIFSPSSRYNCHSYAWYRYTTSNSYWIEDPNPFVDDPACTQVLSPGKYDIAVYVDSAGYALHSGMVTSVSGGIIYVQSKWGQAGVYAHQLANVPKEYCTTPDSGVINVYFFRYHDYQDSYTGNEYHSGSSHFYEYADVCKICNKQINAYWKSAPCSGPPCAMPWALPIRPQPEME